MVGVEISTVENYYSKDELYTVKVYNLMVEEG